MGGRRLNGRNTWGRRMLVHEHEQASMNA